MSGGGLSDEQQKLVTALDGVTRPYLTENVIKPSFGGKVFCAYKAMDVDKADGGASVIEYVFADCQEYSLSGGELRRGAGADLPVALFIQKVNGSYRVVRHEIPGDGSRHSSDVERIFPPKIRREVISYEAKSPLDGDAEKQARDFYRQ
jgi:hypothetical protein